MDKETINRRRASAAINYFYSKSKLEEIGSGTIERIRCCLVAEFEKVDDYVDRTLSLNLWMERRQAFVDLRNTWLANINVGHQSTDTEIALCRTAVANVRDLNKLPNADDLPQFPSDVTLSEAVSFTKDIFDGVIFGHDAHMDSIRGRMKALG